MICHCFIKSKRAGQDQGGPRWDTLTRNTKSTKLHDIVLWYTQGVVPYDPVLFGGCNPPTFTPLKVKPEALILISIGGQTLQCGVMYIFFIFLSSQNWLLSPTVGMASQKAYKTTQIKKCVFLYLTISFNMWQAIHSFGWPRSEWPLSSISCNKFVTVLNHHTDALLLF